jgi:small multidrug resistance pump
MGWTALYLGLTVLFEAFGTACIQASRQFTETLPTCGTIIGYGGAFWFLSLTLRDLPLGVVYATWSGLGILLACASGWVLFGQRPDAAAVAGIALITTGILVMHLFSTGVRG